MWGCSRGWAAVHAQQQQVEWPEGSGLGAEALQAEGTEEAQMAQMGKPGQDRSHRALGSESGLGCVPITGGPALT